MQYLNVEQVAIKLGLTPRRVHSLYLAGLIVGVC